MLKRSVVGLVVAFGLILSGCGTQSGSTIVKYEKGKTARMTEAPKEGSYALYSTTDATPKVVHRLEKGDKVGFMEQEGTIWAIAGEHTEKIDPGMMARNWYWKLQDEK